MNQKNKICIVVSTPLTAHAFLRDQVRAVSHHFEITIAANFLDNPKYKINWKEVKTKDIPLVRSVSPIQDLAALFKLYFFFREEQFSIVHSITPKAGLLGMTAAFLARIPVRVHTFTGQVWVIRKGISRWLLKTIDHFFSFLATNVYADSPSQKDFLIKKKIVPYNKIKVLADGSISGVDLKRFKPDAVARQQVRKTFGLAEDSVMILFLGRMNPDKGITDLASAFGRLSCDGVHLVMVGPDECGMKDHLRELAGPCSLRTHFMDYTAEPETIMAAADIFCLPSYREGFGSVVIEAAACGVPCVTSRIYGLTDAVVQEVTGFLVPPGDIDGLLTALQKLTDDPTLRKKMGIAAQIRVRRLFSQERLTRAILAEYFSMIRCHQGKSNVRRNFMRW